MVEPYLAKVVVAGSNPVSRFLRCQNPECFLRRRTQVAKGAACKAVIRRFDPGRRLQCGWLAQLVRVLA